jgi:cholesterol transport system auxiliary component
MRVAAGIALALCVGACGTLLGKSAPPTYDLTAPRHFPRLAHAARGLLVVPEPTALSILDTERVMVRPAVGEVTAMADAQWSDRLPKLLQARIIQSFENARRLRAVGRPGDRLNPDYQLVTDVRAFQISVASNPVAEVEISAKIVLDRAGRIAAGRVFRATVPAAATQGPAAVEALDKAFAKVVTDMIEWTARII